MMTVLNVNHDAGFVLTTLAGLPDTPQDRTNHRYFVITTTLTSHISLYFYISTQVVYSSYFSILKTSSYLKITTGSPPRRQINREPHYSLKRSWIATAPLSKHYYFKY